MVDSSRKRLVIGNWKMHGDTAFNTELLTALRTGIGSAPQCEVAVCVPFPYLYQTRSLLEGNGVTWGGQDVSQHEKGAYTGEVAASMLADFGCRWALVGHSERRSYHGESDTVVAAKAAAALAAGITPVVCVGETLQEQEAGHTHAVIDRQLAPVLALGADSVAKLVIAYEPVWAIGTGRTATPEQAQEVHALIRQRLREAGAPQVRVLYGGSVKAANAASLFAMPDIDGALVGGAALMASEFLSIAAA